jgi:putative transcriptional regulator
MESGLLYADAATREEAGTTGTAAADAGRGQDVGVSNLSGVMDLQPGTVEIHRVPNVRQGGSADANIAGLREAASRSPLLGAIGIEALAALRRAGLEPGVFYGVIEAVVEAARSGLSSTVICVDNELPRLLGRLGEEGIEYRLTGSSGRR